MGNAIGTFLNFTDPFDIAFSPKGGKAFGIGESNSLVPGNDKKKIDATPAPLPTPQGPKPEDSVAKAEEMARRRKAALSAGGQTIYTSPLGVSGEAQVARKKLLGQ